MDSRDAGAVGEVLAVILLVGGTGRLGRVLCRRLLARGAPVRVMARSPAAAADLAEAGAQVVAGDLRDPASIRRACQGVRQVVAAAHGLFARDPAAVDLEGNRTLIDAARTAGARRFVLVSVAGVRADHPFDFFRFKRLAEEHLETSGLPFTIVRACAFMEFWATLLGRPILDSGRGVVFGRGENPVSFVSALDVARVVDLALEDERLLGKMVEIGGPQALTVNEVAALFAGLAGKPVTIRHVPLPVLKLMRRLVRPFHPSLSRQIEAGIQMDTTDQTVVTRGLPEDLAFRGTPLEDVARSMAGAPKAAGVA